MSITETARFLQSLRTRHERVDELPPTLMPPDSGGGLSGPGRAGRRAVHDTGGGDDGGLQGGVDQSGRTAHAGRALSGVRPACSRRGLHESGVTLDAADYVIRLIEVEIAFRMAAERTGDRGRRPRSPIHRGAHRGRCIRPSSWSSITSPDSTGSRRSRSRPTSPSTAPGSTARRVDDWRGARPGRAADAASRQRRGETDRLGGATSLGHPARRHGMAGQRAGRATGSPLRAATS